MVLAAYPGTRSGDSWAPCDTHSTTSLHHSGRAWDWVVAPTGEAASPSARAQADELLGWLLEPVDGQPDAELGVSGSSRSSGSGSSGRDRRALR